MTAMNLAWFLVLVAITSHFTFNQGQLVSFRFATKDFGFVNETENSFVTLMVEKDGNIGFDLTVIIKLENSTTSDFLTDSWTVLFERHSPETNKSAKIFIEDDDIPEKDETFTFSLHVTTSNNVEIREPLIAHATILANDDANGIIAFDAVEPLRKQELPHQNATATLALRRTRGLFGDVTVTYSVSSNQDDIHADIHPLLGTVSLNDGESYKEFDLFVVDDEIPENDEKFRVTLINSSGGAKINRSSDVTTIVISENDSPLRFAKKIYRAEESDTLDVTVYRGMDQSGVERVGPDNGSVFVEYQVISGTAEFDSDYYVQTNGVLLFKDRQHEANLQIYIKDDDEPEQSENFTIYLVSNSIDGDAIIAEPSVCTVVIETNDNARGALSIDFSNAEFGENKRYFLGDEDAPISSINISVVRLGGSFSTVSVQWNILFNTTSTGDDVFDVIMPTSGTLMFEPGQKRINTTINILENEIPAEAKLLVFKLFPSSLQGGAVLDPPYEADMIISDSDNVYGVFSVEKNRSYFDVGNEQRLVRATITRSGGLIGDVNVKYSAYHLPPETNDVKNALPGILSKSEGILSFKQDEDEKEINLGVDKDAFLQTDSSFVIILDSVELMNRKLLIPAKTPYILIESAVINVTEEYANGEIGFENNATISVVEPDVDPSSVKLQLQRKGLSGTAVVQLSYRGGLNAENGQDYIKGPDAVAFAAGQKVEEIVVQILPDRLPELKETLVVRLDSVTPSNQRLNRNEAETKIIIPENDNPGGIFSFSNASNLHYVIKEDGTETINVVVQRSEGLLARRMIRYDVIPNGSRKFYGVPQVIIFPPGQRTSTIALVPRDDDIPELDTNYTLVLQPHGSPASVLSPPTSVHVTILANDNPHGLLQFRNDATNPRSRIIGESKSNNSVTTTYVVHRSMGTYENVSVRWKILPDDTDDVIPTDGILYFTENQIEEVITIQSSPDQLPESLEEFTILLYNATGGVNIAENENATLIIEPNDKAIYFKGPEIVHTQEGSTVLLTVHRDGSGADVAQIHFRTVVGYSNISSINQHQASDETDFRPIVHDVIVFNPGILDYDVTVDILDDDRPEDDEHFYVELFDAKDDYVAFGNDKVEIMIEQSDDANGVFSFATSNEVILEEGVPNSFQVNRNEGSFGEVSIKWKIVPGNVSNYEEALEKFVDEIDLKSEFLLSKGTLDFEEGDTALNITIEALIDNLPEYDEEFTLLLANATGGGSIGNVVVHITVPINDYPFGLLSFKNIPLPVTIAEDDIANNNVTIRIERLMGSDGSVMALWELRPSDSTLPNSCKDLLLDGMLLNDAEIVKGRVNVNTYAVRLKSDASVSYDKDFQPKVLQNFSLSFWIKIETTLKEPTGAIVKEEVPIIAKYSWDNETIFSITALIRDDAVENMSFIYRNQSGNIQEIRWPVLNDFLNNSWNHLLFAFQNKSIILYHNGVPIADHQWNGASRLEGYFLIGCNLERQNINKSYVLQDLRLYDVTLTSSQAMELKSMTAQGDIIPVSGYVKYKLSETFRNITLYTVNDSKTEDNEDFLLSIIDSTGGAQVDKNNQTLLITTLKSDYANGLFGFSKSCLPSGFEEGQTTTCYISRSRGLFGSVLVEWRINSTGNDTDFLQNQGNLTFLPAESEKTFNITSIKDEIPELNEEHVVILARTTTLDGFDSNTPFSGAAIDSQNDFATITIEKNEKPNGVMQFAIEAPAESPEPGTIHEKSQPPILHVKEEAHYVTLMVERAAGWFGHVTCEWRTRDGTAISYQLPKDFEASAGTLHFQDGQSYAEFSIELVDDQMSELEKFFFVELSAPTGGASLNNASTIKVIIDPSDDAFGIFNFNQTQIIIAEPAKGMEEIRLQVKREGGTLGNSTVYWKIRTISFDDVTPMEGQLEFNEGQTADYIFINVLADNFPEFDEVIQVDLATVSEGSVGSASSCELTILANNDPRGVFTFDPLSTFADEEDGDVTVTIQRSGGLAGVIRVYYSTMDTNPNRTKSAEGIALPDQDFSTIRDSVLFRDNVTHINITISIFNDEIPEADEIFFIQLQSAELESSGVQVPDSPRLGSTADILMEVVITENDSPHGVLEFSEASVRVQEDFNATDASSKEFLYVIRKLGNFGDVTVSFIVIPGTARAEEDYNVNANQVTLLNGETKKAVPIHIINDFTPEIEEEFRVELMHNSVTGGAQVGTEDGCDVTIEESDDPYGLFEISADFTEVEEPSSGIGIPITFTVTRQSGKRGLVGLGWVVDIRPSPSAAPGGDRNSTKSLSNNDVDVRSGSIYFVTNQDLSTFVIKILPDDLPEDDELVVVKLHKVLSGHKGRINPLRNEVRILIPANDRPYGDVSLKDNIIMTHENDNDDDTAAVVVERSGGSYGMLRVIYSTAEIDLVSEMLEKQQNILENYLPSKIVDSIDGKAFFQPVDISSSQDPQLTCAEACLRQRICNAFLYQPVSYECKWTNQESVSRQYIRFPSDDIELSPSYLIGRFSFYEKNHTRTSLLYNSQARSDLDFRPLSGASVLFYPGQKSALINISILTDNLPELKEYFQLSLLDLEMVDFIPKESDRPMITSPSSSRITIQENDYPYGLFVLRGQGEKINDSIVVKIEEKPKLSVELVVEREGGSVGLVTVDWSFVGGTALRNSDFNGDDATLKFAHGETTKVISLSIIDDASPEPDKTILIQLHNPTGGAVLDDNSSRSTVIILANDVVGGVIGFASSSKSLIAQEGDSVTLHLVRSEPAFGRCIVTWIGEGLDGHSETEGLNITNGQVIFEEGQTRGKINVQVTADNTPETKERYKIVLDHVETTGISKSGSAILNAQSYEAEITIQDSDDPHGVFQFAPDSQRINIKEDQEQLEVFVTRKFGSIGKVKVYYDVIPGTLSTVNPDIDVARPGIDFTYTENEPSILFGDGATSAPIVMKIINDDVPELVEIFHVNITRTILIGPNGNDATPLLPPQIDNENSLSQVAIDANDGTKGEVSFNISSANIYTTEGSVVRLNIYRDKGAYGEVTAFIYPQNKEAEQDQDYICQPQTLIFSDSQRILTYEIEIVDDVIPEGNESFVVLLNNPSAGLELGNITMATVTIASNDDAHGRLSFNNELLIEIDEPESFNFNNSVVTLIIKRSPPSGVFGEVSVQFKVNEVAANGDIIDDSRNNDLIPKHGFVTIEDGVSETTLDISATVDDQPELDRKYRVTLFNPGQGATLGNNRTSCEVIVKENDAPYGFFQVFPTGFKNGSRMVRVNENSDKLLSVDVVRNKGSLGFVSVVLDTQPDTAEPLPTSNQYPPFLAPFQNLPPSSGVWFHAFQHSQNSYLLYLTNELASPLTTQIGSRGTLNSLTAGVHSTLYKWQGVYSPLQTIETDGATCATTFAIDDVMYAFITNAGSTIGRETMSRLYSLNTEGLQVVQDIPTKGAAYAVYFHTDQHYLVIANSEDNNQISTVDSTVLRFSVTSGLFEEVQSLPTRGAAGLTVFSRGKRLYLAIANRYDSEIGPNTPLSSVVYTWNSQSSSFIRPHSVDVSHAQDVQYHKVDDQCFLIFTIKSPQNAITNTDRQSIKIFQMFSNNNRDGITMRPHQLLNVTGASKTQLLQVPIDALASSGEIQARYIRNNSILFMLVSSNLISKVFIFNYQSLLFTSFLEAASSSHMEAHVINYRSQSVVVVVAMAKYDVSTKLQTSLIDKHSKSPIDYSEIKSSSIYDLVNVHKSNSTILNSGMKQGDYVSNRKVLSFEPGETTRTLLINLLNDDVPEDEEVFKISLYKTFDKRAVVDDVTSLLNIEIEANDDAFGVIGFDEDSVEKRVEETSSDNIFTLNVIRHKASFGRVSVDWSAEGNINDVTPVAGQVIFEKGQTKVPIQMTVLADILPEVEETVGIELSNPKVLGRMTSIQPTLNISRTISLVRIPPNDSPHGLVRWAPSSLRVVVKEAEEDIDSSKLVTLELIREQGAMGDITVHFKTARAEKLPLTSQASPGEDFIPRDSSLLMRENSTRAAISISIIPDDVPEDIESFYVIIDDVRLNGESSLGGKPGIADDGSNVADISIEENDNARGFVQFNATPNSEGAVDAYELPRINNSLKLPLARSIGFARTVGVEWLAQPVTAGKEDFFPKSGFVEFKENKASGEIEIFIIDDDKVEFLESFTVQLVGTTGGVQLGGDLVVTVNILPNDSPSGMFGFLQASQRVLESSSPTDPMGKVEFTVRRFQGSDDEITLLWELEESARNDLSPMSGRLTFPSGIRSRSIILRSIPDQELEGVEIYNLNLITATGGAEISPVAREAKVVIAADRGAAGSVSLQTRSLYVGEPENGFDGRAVLALARGPTAFGKVHIQWEITPADGNTFSAVSGDSTFEDGQNTTEILIEVLDDDIPEKAQTYVLRIHSPTGGADLSKNDRSCMIKVVASDNPHGVFSLSQPVYDSLEGDGANSVTSLTDFTSYVSVSVVRSKGTMGRVSLRLSTDPGSAQANVDYYPVDEVLVFEEGEEMKRVDIEIINDNRPEGPEEFFVNTTNIRLLSHSGNDYSPQPPFNLSIDKHPVFGELSWSLVRIAKSDGAEGIVEFGEKSGEIRIREEAGEIQVQLVRHSGDYGNIFVVINSINQTARRNVDFLMPSSGITVKFEDGQTTAHMSITIIDDQLIENEETFTLAITSISNGGRIGERKFLNVIILKSEYPNGVLRFVEESHVTMENPTEEKVLRFNLERYGGNQLPVSVDWKISRISPFIAPTTRDSSLASDITSPTTGVFLFGDGQGDRRELFVRILPASGDQEVEEHFAILLEDADPAEISQDKGNITITVLKKGHPNGVVRFGRSSESTLSNTPRIVEEPDSGTIPISFPISRMFGSIGMLNIFWSVTSENRLSGAAGDDVTKVNGFIQMRDSQIDADVIVSVKADTVAELDEVFLLSLTSVDGGAEIDRNHSLATLIIRANDDPHGIFALEPQNQRIVVTSRMTRLLRVNVTRVQGTFGTVTVEFSFRFDEPTEGTSYVTTNTGSLLFSDSVTWLSEDIVIPDSAFLAVGDSFTVQLTNVQFLGEKMYIEPTISAEYSSAKVLVSDEAGNAEIGFDSRVAQVQDTYNNICNLSLIRHGLFGDISSQWTIGYPSQLAPSGITLGTILPSSDVINMESGEKESNFRVEVFPHSDPRSVFALHLSRVNSPVGGGAKILTGHELVEIDPCGAIHFTSSSRNVAVMQKIRQVNLTVERKYGSQHAVDVSFNIVPVSSVAEIDYFPPDFTKINFKDGQKTANISISLPISESNRKRRFNVELTTAAQPENIYEDKSPRILIGQHISHVTILESPDAHGYFSFRDVIIRTKENSDDGSDVRFVMVTIKRTVGSVGYASVVASTASGRNRVGGDIIGEMDLINKWEAEVGGKDETKMGIGDVDYEIRSTNVSFPEGTNSVSIPVVILNDDVSEPGEYFFVYLHSPFGGARIDQEAGVAKITIEANDNPNGIVGFVEPAYSISENSFYPSPITVRRSHAFGNVTIKWQASDHGQDTSLDEQLVETSGSLVCLEHQLTCEIELYVKDDEEAEFARMFILEIYEVGEGAEIDPSHRFVNVTITDSDYPWGLFQFQASSRLPIVTKDMKTVGLTIERIGGNLVTSRFRLRTKELDHVASLTGLAFYPAVSDVDFESQEKEIIFQKGQQEVFTSITLYPDGRSGNPLPQMFHVILDSPSGVSAISKQYNVANVTIFADNKVKRVWKVYEALQQELSEVVLQKVLVELHEIADGDIGEDQIKIFHESLNRVLSFGRQSILAQHTLNEIYELFCKLLDPSRTDSVRGYSKFIQSFDQLALCMMTDTDCVTNGEVTSSLTSCKHAMVQSSRWYPELINGYNFRGKNRDNFKIPTDLLDVSTYGAGSSNPQCFQVYFIELTSSTWFDIERVKNPMSQKVFSVGVDGKLTGTLSTPVRYRVYTSDARVSPKGAECVIWNHALSGWSSSTQELCSVVDDSSNYIECECNHMSVYAATGPTDNLASYNAATYVASFIAMISCFLVPMCHFFCARRFRFATKLLMHYFFACAATQLFFVASAFSSDENLGNSDACAAMALLFSYFWLAQFTWMLSLGIYVLQTLSFNKESTNRTFLGLFLFGWGFPAFAVLGYVIFMYAFKGDTTSIKDMYGDVNDNGEMCAIKNVYGALLSAVLPACLCMLIVMMIVLHLYQKEGEWKKFDDIFYGRFNSREIQLLCWLFFLVSFTWLNGGLHLAYGYLWMLCLFIAFNFITGFYVLVVYDIFRCPLLNKSETMYDGRLDKPDALAQEYHTASFGAVPSISGDVINKSSQSLMKIDDRWQPNESQILAESIIGLAEDSTKEESDDFDDLILALNMENGEQELSPVVTFPEKEEIRQHRRRASPVPPTLQDSNESFVDGRKTSFGLADTHL